MRNRSPFLPSGTLFKIILSPLILFVVISLVSYAFLSFRTQKREQTLAQKTIKAYLESQRTHFEEEIYLEKFDAIRIRLASVEEHIHDRFPAARVCVSLSLTDRNTPSGLDYCPGEDFASPTRQSLALPVSVGDTQIGTLAYELDIPFVWSALLDLPMVLAFLMATLISVLTIVLLIGRIQKLMISPLLTKLTQQSRKVAVADTARQVAHDIRSPLAAIRMGLGQLSHPDTRGLLAKSVSRLEAIAEDLLHYNSQKLMVAQENRSIADVVEDVVEEKRTTNTEGPALQLVIEENTRAMRPPSGPYKLDAVIGNLINNAVEASDKKGEVRISVRSDHDSIELSIEDDGCGIPPEILEKLGKEEVSHGKLQGHGIGVLSASKTLSQMGGHLRVLSKPKTGTVVELQIPAERTN